MNIEPEHPHHHAPQTGVRWLDMAITIAVLLISATSLILTIEHSRTLERMADANVKLVEANSWPFLAYSTGNTNGREAAINMSVDNNGIGPAKIESFVVTWNRIPQHNAPAFLKACCGYAHRPGDGLQFSVVQGQVLRAGNRLNFLYLPRTRETAAAWDALNSDRISKRLDVNICYCSVFDECWGGDITQFTLHPRPVAKCAPSKTPFDP
jgi:hypothetical protein